MSTITTPPSQCTDALQTATDFLDQLLITSAATTACTSTTTTIIPCPIIPLPSDTTPLTDLTTACATTAACSAVTTPTISTLLACSIRRVHNVDLPIESMCRVLFRGELSDPPGNCPVPTDLTGLWGEQLTATGIVLPRIDGLSSSDPSDYWVLRNWFYLLDTYASTARQLNRYDLLRVERAVTEIRTSIEFAERDMDQFYADQRESDRLQAAVDCPEACARAVEEAYAQEARERVLARRSADSSARDNIRCRPRRRTQRLYIPLDRSPMSDFDHLLNDIGFDNDAARANENLATLRLRQKGIRRAQLLAVRIGEILAHCQRVFGQLCTLVDQLLLQWSNHRLLCGLPDAPLGLTQKLAFQRPLKALLLDVRTYMRQQVVEGVALGQQRCNHGGLGYIAWFGYQISDCPPTPYGPSSCMALQDSDGNQWSPNQVLIHTANQLVVQRAKTVAIQAVSGSEWTAPGSVSVTDVRGLMEVLGKSRTAILVAGGC